MSKHPKDIMIAAERVYDKLGRGSDSDVEAIAKALADERERCAKIADLEAKKPIDWARSHVKHVATTIRGGTNV